MNMRRAALLCISLLGPVLLFRQSVQAAPVLPAGYTGTLILYDLQTGQFSGLQPEQWDVGTLPASTYKIPNSLIGLETGVIPGIDFVIPWDGVTRSIAAWNQDHSLKSAFAVSCVPYYQELARRVGFASMRQWNQRLGFGSMDVQAGNLDEFWLRGRSRISPREQVQFLARLLKRELPLSLRSQDLVEQIMLREATPRYRYFGKTGWVQGAERELGWFVGAVRRDSQIWVFATRLEAKRPDPAVFGPAREAYTKAFLTEQGLLN
ncbi:MAG: penicillin-binding transpeptidase domain-containing protein [Candidatus Sericytochromatia bacterium]